MRPIVDGLEQEYRDRIAFRRLNATDAAGRQVFDRYQLRGHPSYVILGPDGTERWKFTGQTTRGVLDEAIRQALGPEG
jgi:thiol:disulfide interchange protein